MLPKEKDNVAMRFIGSHVIIPGAIRTYGDGIARISKGWPLYAQEHNLCIGEVFVCRIHRGPSVWEMLCRSLSVVGIYACLIFSVRCGPN